MTQIDAHKQEKIVFKDVLLFSIFNQNKSKAAKKLAFIEVCRLKCIRLLQCNHCQRWIGKGILFVSGGGAVSISSPAHYNNIDKRT
jgi:hypothetical protein